MNRPPAWQSQAYLDVLRPNPGCEVRGAILTSYSADIASIVAALLALAARDNDSGSGRKTDLAEAIELLRGKVRILIQRGRLARPRRIPLITGILDQFVREIDFDERKQSWHPKVSLVEFVNGSGASDWRMWFGSRNLTATVNRDFGLLLNSEADPKVSDASPIPGEATFTADADNGARLAQRWCASCHVISSAQRVEIDHSPSFASIAQRADFSAEKLAFFLLEPHPKMPNMSLSRKEADDLAACIAEQRR